MSSTFLRFQEFYENPEFRGKIFSREQFIAWYTEQQGSFTYFDEWEGHNIPSSVLTPFYEGLFDPLAPEETDLLQTFRGKAHPFYIIASFEQSAADDHELAHGFYTVRPSYRNAADSLLACHNTKVLEEYLAFRKCYHRDIWDDEKQAFLSTSLSRLVDFDFDVSSLHEAHVAFKALFSMHKKHFSESEFLAAK